MKILVYLFLQQKKSVNIHQSANFLYVLLHSMQTQACAIQTETFHSFTCQIVSQILEETRESVPKRSKSINQFFLSKNNLKISLNNVKTDEQGGLPGRHSSHVCNPPLPASALDAPLRSRGCSSIIDRWVPPYWSAFRQLAHHASYLNGCDF